MSMSDYFAEIPVDRIAHLACGHSIAFEDAVSGWRFKAGGEIFCSTHGAWSAVAEITREG